jgi:hypothetical protein
VGNLELCSAENLKLGWQAAKKLSEGTAASSAWRRADASLLSAGPTKFRRQRNTD